MKAEKLSGKLIRLPETRLTNEMIINIDYIKHINFMPKDELLEVQCDKYNFCLEIGNSVTESFLELLK